MASARASVPGTSRWAPAPAAPVPAPRRGLSASVFGARGVGAPPRRPRRRRRRLRRPRAPRREQALDALPRLLLELRRAPRRALLRVERRVGRGVCRQLLRPRVARVGVHREQRLARRRTRVCIAHSRLARSRLVQSRLVSVPRRLHERRRVRLRRRRRRRRAVRGALPPHAFVTPPVPTCAAVVYRTDAPPAPDRPDASPSILESSHTTRPSLAPTANTFPSPRHATDVAPAPTATEPVRCRFEPVEPAPTSINTTRRPRTPPPARSARPGRTSRRSRRTGHRR